jgi:lysophospholipase L1-like esterase
MSQPAPARIRSRLVAALVAALSLSAAIAGAPASASTAKVGPPTSIDALGDSITRGYDSQGSGCGALADCPAFSWATGDNAAVNSYYNRVKALNPSVVLARPRTSGTAGGNDAVTGAKMTNLVSQATNAVSAPNRPDTVLILLGANDVCTSSEAAMTSVANFRSQFDAGMNVLSAGLPDARIVVSSIPNIWQLWNTLHNNFLAQLTWGTASICQSMLASPTSTTQANIDRRARVQQRNIDFNTVLAQECAKYIHCHWDNNAAYNVVFASSDVSTLDYFHPNTSGQAKAAGTLFAAGPNYADVSAPTTTIARDHVSLGVDDWYKDNVTVTVSAADSNDAVAGSEFFYKLDGAADQPWTKYTGPVTVSTEGTTDFVARSVDSNGNISASTTDVIKIDKTKPAFTLTCPSGSIVLGADAQYTVSGATDDRSGFATDPSGSFPIPTTEPGSHLIQQEIEDKAGNTFSRSCTINIVYPDPGTPALSAGTSPNGSGVFTLAWTGADPALFGIRYSLEHADANDASYSEVATGIDSLSSAFTAGAPEGEGTWTYRVKGSDAGLGLDTSYSATSDPVVVDKSAPGAPTLTADRLPDYSGAGGWFKDTVTVSFADNGDPALQDGSAGTGVDPSSVPAAVTKATSGSHTVSGTVADLAGNESAAGSLTVQVDATAPTVGVICPAAVLLHSAASATITASDGESGLAVDPSGTATIDTSSVGPRISSASATDNVSHDNSASCTTAVQYLYGGLAQPINPDGSSIFKFGSTVPVKFHLTDAAGNPVAGAIARLEVAKVSNNVEGSFVEADTNVAATSGNLFRDSGSGDYIFNLNTKPLSAGTWSLKVVMDDGTEYRTRVSFR